jgi:hypothetical protein
MKDAHAHAQTLLRDLSLINARTVRELGPLPPGGLPVEPKRKPNLPKRAAPPTRIESPQSNEESDMDWTRIAATATLTAAVSLSACAADQGAQTSVTPPPPPTQAEPVAAVPEATQAQTAVDQKPTVEDQEAEPERGPPIAAAELRRRVLALIESFQSLEDLERKNVERRLEFRLTRMQGMSEGYEYDGLTSEGWQYGISTAKLSRLDEPSTIIIGMDYDFDYNNHKPPAYCTLEFESLAKEIVAMGYERSEKLSRLKGNDWWNFKKKAQKSAGTFYLTVYLYLVPDAQNASYCIKSFEFSGE